MGRHTRVSRCSSTNISVAYLNNLYNMKTSLILLLLQCTITLVAAEEETKDLNIEDSEDLGRRHRKRKKHQNQNPCYGGYGRTFGQENTYISAPVTNYFFGCPPIAPVQLPNIQNHHGPHHFHSSHGHGGQGNHGQGYFGYGHGGQNYYGQGQFGQGHLVDGSYQQRPFQNVAVSAAAALANYITRPKKTQKQINQFLRPLYNLL